MQNIITRCRSPRKVIVPLIGFGIALSVAFCSHDPFIEQSTNIPVHSLARIALTHAIPSVRAQPETPSPPPGLNAPPVPSETPSESSSDPPDSESSTDPSEERKATLLKEENIVKVVIAVLVGVIGILIMLLSPVVGTRGEASLQEKGEFLLDTFPSVLQGITVLLIVMIVAVLTLARVINEQGSISILSALIGYVLGKRSSELERSSGSAVVARPAELKIVPKTDAVNVGKEVVIEIIPPQAIEDNIALNPASTGSVRISGKSAIIYRAPNDKDKSGQLVTITAQSRDNTSLKPAQAKIMIID